MARRHAILAVLVSAFWASSARADIPWADLFRYLVRIGVAGGAEVLRDAVKTGRPFWDGATGKLIDDGKHLIDSLIALEGQADREGAAALRSIRTRIDRNVTRAEFQAMVARVNAEMANHEMAIRNLEYRQSLLEGRTKGAEDSIADLQSYLYARDRQFQHTLNRIDLSLTEVRGRVASLERNLEAERAQREAGQAWLQRQIDEAAGRIDRLETAISPNTRRQTAAHLGATAALALIRASDPVEAVRTLQLSIAYDKISNPHVDPGARYFLAIAYRRQGESTRADEMVSEAIAAERFRELPEWYGFVIERLQHEDRRWLEGKRYDPRFGVRAPREVVTAQP